MQAKLKARSSQMKIIHTISELKSEISNTRTKNKKIGFVPTMGALHDGHLSLVKCAQEKSDYVVVSIFVNPTQFAPHEDFDQYPRTEKDDADLLQRHNVDILFLPTKEELYPDGLNSKVKAGSAAQGLETLFRPHFFDGVVNVVNRLFQAVTPDIAVFGEKDFQQLQVIKEIVEDLKLPIEIIGAPIARDDHGLALSSRNAYLSESELKIARTLNIVLKKAAQSKDYETAKAELLSNGFNKIDYLEERWNRALAAAWLGKTRLIDNMGIK